MTTITPQKFFPPRTEGWSHNIKAADGYYYGCPEKFITLFQIGQPIDVEVTIKEKDGKTYRDIKRVIPNGNGHPAPTPQRPAQAPQGRYGENDATAERIFVCGLLNAIAPKVYEKEGKMDSGLLIVITNAARRAWSETFGKKDEPDA